MITEFATGEPETDLSRRCHPLCIACGACNGSGLGLRFHAEPDGSVVGTFACDGKYQGYPRAES